MGIEDVTTPDPSGTITLEEHRRRNGQTPSAPSLPPRRCHGCGVQFQPFTFGQSFHSAKCRRAADPTHDATNPDPGDGEAVAEALAMATQLIGQLLDTPGADVAATLQAGRVRIVVEVAAE